MKEPKDSVPVSRARSAAIDRYPALASPDPQIETVIGRVQNNLPAALNSRSILQLQQSVGNRQVVRLLKTKQNGHGGLIQAERPPPRDKILYTDEVIDVILDRISSATPPVRPFEVISATTSAQFSSGELEKQVEKLWKRERLTFTAAARKAARENIASREERGSPLATQSPEMKPAQPYKKRWQIGLYAIDYQRSSDLPEIARLMRKGSPFQKSLGAEFDKVINIRNPTSVEMNAQITNAIFGLYMAKERHESAELVVFFSGHGGGGTIAGVDEGHLDSSDLARTAEFAADFGIHMIYVLDTCRGGQLTALAHAAAAGELGEQIAGLPEHKKASAEQQHALFTKLSTASLNLKDKTIDALDRSRDYWKKRIEKNNLPRLASIMALQAALGEMDQALGMPGLDEAALPRLEFLRKLSKKIRFLAFFVLSGRRSDMVSLLNDIAELLDILNDSMNSMLLNLEDQVKGG